MFVYDKNKDTPFCIGSILSTEWGELAVVCYQWFVAGGIFAVVGYQWYVFRGIFLVACQQWYVASGMLTVAGKGTVQQSAIPVTR